MLLNSLLEERKVSSTEILAVSLISFLFGYIATEIYGYFSEERDKKKIKKIIDPMCPVCQK